MMKKITSSDGHAFECWVEPAVGPAKAGLVILQEIFGVTDQLKSVAQRYTAQGYNVAIPALFDRQQPGAVVPFSEPSTGKDLMLAVDPDGLWLDIEAAINLMGAGAELKVMVMGFCWGGGLAVRSAQLFDIAGAVSFYGTRLSQYLDRPLKAPVQLHIGLSDDHTPTEVVDAVVDYLPDIEVFSYPAGHAFANDQRPSYVATAAEQAHERSLQFFNDLVN